MLDTFFITSRVKVAVAELGAVVTSDFDNVDAELPLSSSCKGLEEFEHLVSLS